MRMKKLFTLVAMTLLAMGINAQTIIWSEDWTGYVKNDLPSANNANYTEVGSGTKIYEEQLAGGEKPELLIGKSGGSFTVKINLNGADGEMTLAYKANYDRITVSVNPTTVVLGEKVQTGNDYSIPVTVPAGETEISITFSNSNSSNVRFDNAKLYQGTAKASAGLSWGTASRTVTLGSNDNVFPVLTNENALPITYDSSDPSVATIDTDGFITLIGPGKTNITAEFVGNDDFEASKVTYELTVKEAGGETPSGETKEVNVQQAIELIAALEDGAKTTDDFIVKGFVVGIDEISVEFGNATFTIADSKGGTELLTVYRAKGFDGEKITDAEFIKVDDEVVVKGKLQKYVKDGITTPEVASGGVIMSINGAASVSRITADDTNAPIYNIAGQRVEKTVKGVYIQNGKKFVVK